MSSNEDRGCRQPNSPPSASSKRKNQRGGWPKVLQHMESTAGGGIGECTQGPGCTDVGAPRDGSIREQTVPVNSREASLTLPGSSPQGSQMARALHLVGWSRRRGRRELFLLSFLPRRAEVNPEQLPMDCLGQGPGHTPTHNVAGTQWWPEQLPARG